MDTIENALKALRRLSANLTIMDFVCGECDLAHLYAKLRSVGLGENAVMAIVEDAIIAKRRAA